MPDPNTPRDGSILRDDDNAYDTPELRQQGNAYDTVPDLQESVLRGDNAYGSPQQQQGNAYDTVPDLQQSVLRGDNAYGNPQQQQGNAYDTVPELQQSVLRGDNAYGGPQQQQGNAYDTVPELQPQSVLRGDNPYGNSSAQQGQDPDDLGQPGLNQRGPTAQERGFAMKSLEKTYREQEKNAAASTVKVNGQDISVREKEWQRQDYNKQAAEKNLPFATQEMWARAKDAPVTQYLNEEQRQDYAVNIEDGKLKNNSGGSLKPGNNVFVMDSEGQLYADEERAYMKVGDSGKKTTIHHSSFLSGEDVAGAGELHVDKEGELKRVTDRSGHYRPGEAQTKQTLEHLEDQGVNLDNVKFTQDRGWSEAEKTHGMAREYLQGQVTPEEQAHREQYAQDTGAKLSDTSKVMEKNFKDRHNVVDEIKAGGQNLKATLNDTGGMDRLKQQEQQRLDNLKAQIREEKGQSSSVRDMLKNKPRSTNVSAGGHRNGPSPEMQENAPIVQGSKNFAASKLDTSKPQKFDMAKHRLTVGESLEKEGVKVGQQMSQTNKNSVGRHTM